MLTSPIEKDSSDGMRALVETAIFAQRFHASQFDLYYARWSRGRSRGEVDIVNPSRRWAIEVNWSDRFVRHPEELMPLREFCTRNRIADCLITTRSAWADMKLDDVHYGFLPASLYCFSVGRSVIHGQETSPSKQLSGPIRATDRVEID